MSPVALACQTHQWKNEIEKTQKRNKNEKKPKRNEMIYKFRIFKLSNLEVLTIRISNFSKGGELETWELERFDGLRGLRTWEGKELEKVENSRLENLRRLRSWEGCWDWKRPVQQQKHCKLLVGAFMKEFNLKSSLRAWENRCGLWKVRDWAYHLSFSHFYIFLEWNLFSIASSW